MKIKTMRVLSFYVRIGKQNRDNNVYAARALSIRYVIHNDVFTDIMRNAQCAMRNYLSMLMGMAKESWFLNFRGCE